jgi:hypothetical protein
MLCYKSMRASNPTCVLESALECSTNRVVSQFEEALICREAIKCLRRHSICFHRWTRSMSCIFEATEKVLQIHLKVCDRC